MLEFLSPIEKGIKWEINWKDQPSDENNEPEQSILEGKEGSEDVVDAMDCRVVGVLLDCVQ